MRNAESLDFRPGELTILGNNLDKLRRRELYKVASNVVAGRLNAIRRCLVAHAQREVIRATAGARPLSDDDMLRSQRITAPTKWRHSENCVSALLGQLRSVSTTLSKPFQNKLLTRSRAN